MFHIIRIACSDSLSEIYLLFHRINRLKHSQITLYVVFNYLSEINIWFNKINKPEMYQSHFSYPKYLILF